VAWKKALIEKQVYFQHIDRVEERLWGLRVQVEEKLGAEIAPDLRALVLEMCSCPADQVDNLVVCERRVEAGAVRGREIPIVGLWDVERDLGVLHLVDVVEESGARELADCIAKVLWRGAHVEEVEGPETYCAGDDGVDLVVGNGGDGVHNAAEESALEGWRRGVQRH
jgi:hypothetical protein